HDGEVFPELRTVLYEAAPQSVEYFDREPFRVGIGLHHDRWHCGDQNGCGDPLRAMASDVARNLPSACRVADQSDILEIKRLNNRCEIVCVPIHVVSGPGLAGPPVSTPVVRNHPESILSEEMKLAIPCVGTQRPSMRKRYDWALAPVFVVDCRAIFHRNRAHV